MAAAKLAAPYCDAVDLNLGCPQNIAKRGHYGAFLEDEWELIASLVKAVHEQVNIPITCKCRVFDDVNKTVEYAKMLVASGAQILTVHGRTRIQKGAITGLADWNQIKAVKDAVNVPVFANGNIQSLTDALNCLEATSCDAVMSAEGLLHNPGLFSGFHHPVWTIAAEYLQAARLYPCPMSYARGHLFKIMHHVLLLEENSELRHILAKARILDETVATIEGLREKYATDEEQKLEFSTYPIPIYLCQPYYRCSAGNTNLNQTSSENEQSREKSSKSLSKSKKRKSENEDDNAGDSSKKVKGRVHNPLCSLCPNPRGAKCTQLMCKKCCKIRALSDFKDCPSHRFKFSGRTVAQTQHHEIEQVS